MKRCTWMVAVVGVSWLVCAAVGEEPKGPPATRVVIRSPVPGTTAVLSVVEEGTTVKKGDVLLKLDDSEVQAELVRSRIELDAAAAETIAAKASVQLAESQHGEVGVAETELKVVELRRRCASAQLDLELKMLQRHIELGEKSFGLAKERHEMMVAHKDEIGALDMAAAELEILKMTAELETAVAKKQLLELMHPLKEAELELAVKQTQWNLVKTKRATVEQAAMAKAALMAVETKLRLKQTRVQRVEELLSRCTIHAPQDGTVRYLGRLRITEGALVREHQTLMILVDEKPTSSRKAY